jgi:hypothetical protein
MIILYLVFVLNELSLRHLRDLHPSSLILRAWFFGKNLERPPSINDGN